MYERVRVQRWPSRTRAAAAAPSLRVHSPIQYKLTVGRADDPAEREADTIASTVIARLRDGTRGGSGAPDAASRADRLRRAAANDTVAGGEVSAAGEHDLRSPGGVGRAAPDGGAVLRRMEGAFGADFGGVRLHTGADVDVAAAGLQARAFTVGRDVYIRRSEYRPGTDAGDRLIAHELTHTLQQGGSKVRRSTADPVEVRHHLGGRHISTKKEKMHLDFVRMKRMDPQFSKIIGKIVGVDLGGEEQSGGTYGHWWTEIGELDPLTNEFDYDRSYGWWPKDGVGGVKETFGGVEGALNAGETQDPHAGETAPIEFHPVMEVDTAKETYDQIRDRITKQIDTTATSYKGKWHWRFGWGKNCHTFQQHLKTKAGIHYQKSKKWLYDPAAQVKAAEKHKAAKLDEERREANLKMAQRWIDIKSATITTTDPATGRDLSIQTGGRIGPTGKTMKDQMGFDCIEIVTAAGAMGWILELEWRQYEGTFSL
jgi:Domain of unknown function (DUF4157)